MTDIQKNTFENIKKDFEITYKVLMFYKLVEAPIPYELLNKLSRLSYIIFGKTDFIAL
jgi:hypothetical protein